ncbi:MAG: hypothetical protein ACKOWG_06930 [Planctomycetia bacterium]|jgi:hypothetical protein
MKQSRIPHTDSIAELAAFWSTHDVTDFEDELEVVTDQVFARRAEQSRPGPTSGKDLLLQLDPEEAVTVSDAARARGIDEAAVVREWIREHAPKAAG